jgi:phosphoglycerate dehydrogenase-like enzyme
MPCILVEEDRILRLVQVILSQETSQERLDAFTDFNSTDQPDFPAWLTAIRGSLDQLYPSNVKLINSQEEMHQYLPDAHILIVESLQVGKTELEMAKQLSVVYKFGTNLDNIDQQACKDHGMPLFTLRRRTNTAMAEHTMMCILALAKRLPLINGLITKDRLAAANFNFRPYDTRHTAGANFARVPQLLTLRGCTLGLLGCGEIGQEVALMAKAFGMKVLYHKRQALSHKEEAQLGVEYRSFTDLFSESTFISVHVPFADATKDLVNASALALMPKGSFLINTSRAPIVSHDALVEALQNNHLAGAACDVHYTEPAAENEPLLDMNQVILTPHLGGGSRMNGLLDAQEMLLTIQQVMKESSSV